jgi:glycosyltransferase 2 family protein
LLLVRGRDADVRILTTGALVFGAGAVAARRPAVGRVEQRCFAVVNALPVRIHVPAWTVMQLGSLAGPALASAISAAAGRRRLARQLVVAGASTWLAAKLCKQLVRRGRPMVALGRSRVLGREQRGLGYPSGHAAVAVSLYVVASPQLTPVGRRLAGGVAAAVGLARLYVGAHLPLDVIGGIGLGQVLAAAVRLVSERPEDQRSRPGPSRSSWRS